MSRNVILIIISVVMVILVFFLKMNNVIISKFRGSKLVLRRSCIDCNLVFILVVVKEIRLSLVVIVLSMVGCMMVGFEKKKFFNRFRLFVV